MVFTKVRSAKKNIKNIKNGINLYPLTYPPNKSTTLEKRASATLAK
jgi:hypothetical protein